ncbi:SEL1-like repeat protein [Caballeronia sp. EK]|uniref:SEL1-like repeat protein n=1 Tax=Caballeronia sp. EK TaxID=2767469 RepID=UPI002816804C|nr:DUF6396 domain-containing protein [Caballeronia sp. EK]
MTASVPDLNGVRANLAFSCEHEATRLPRLDVQAEHLFAYGRYLNRKDGDKDFNEIARYYRIAAAYGHYKANHSLQLIVSQGFAESPDSVGEVLGLAEQLVQQGVPGGYYDIGHYLEIGYGFKRDTEMSLRYFRKAADLGSPEGQYYVAEVLSPHDRAPDIAKQMYACAADQGHDRAALSLGLLLQLGEKQYAKAVQFFQRGVEAGNSMSASMLAMGFDGASPDGTVGDLALQNDPERARRYRAIEDFLDARESRNPKIPDIERIVPLPPEKLPPWDGTFAWQKQEDRAIAPQRPSEEVIRRMAKDRNLDPATGLPNPPEKKGDAAGRVPLGATLRAFEHCPETGVWKAFPPTGYVSTNADRFFRKGDKFPLIDVKEPRKMAVLDSLLGARRITVDGDWRLISYGDNETGSSG